MFVFLLVVSRLGHELLLLPLLFLLRLLLGQTFLRCLLRGKADGVVRLAAFKALLNNVNSV